MSQSTETRTEPNTQLFLDVLAQIEREPQLWTQGHYREETDCGTAHCFAGWATRLVTGSDRWMVDIDGERLAIPDAANRLLGVNGWGGDDSESCLFYQRNTLDDLYRISADILNLDETVLREKVAAEINVRRHGHRQVLRAERIRRLSIRAMFSRKAAA